ncbi:MAG: hypothetical protein CMD54_05285 [Gammaproteobacteria bacterium]|nr:hypothetical protein [Gammaproteobacteria bacterium]HAN81425.1 hypothetical protein [Gammaproteobacteria bacterium]
MFSVDSESYNKSWTDLKSMGISAIDQGESTIDVSAWTQASSAHLAVLVFWWQLARKSDRKLTLTGLNPTFKTLAELGGVTCIETGECDASH